MVSKGSEKVALTQLVQHMAADPQGVDVTVIKVSRSICRALNIAPKLSPALLAPRQGRFGIGNFPDRSPFAGTPHRGFGDRDRFSIDRNVPGGPGTAGTPPNGQSQGPFWDGRGPRGGRGGAEYGGGWRGGPIGTPGSQGRWQMAR